MTEKKYYVKKSENQKEYLILDKKDNHCVCVLNIEQMNQEIKDWCMRFFNALNELYEENQQLKAQLRKGKDVCGICKYQYLTKTSIDRYYIAKCKKEHDECSRGTVNYCEDFKCKEG